MFFSLFLKTFSACVPHGEPNIIQYCSRVRDLPPSISATKNDMTRQLGMVRCMRRKIIFGVRNLCQLSRNPYGQKFLHGRPFLMVKNFVKFDTKLQKNRYRIQKIWALFLEDFLRPKVTTPKFGVGRNFYRP